MAGVQNSHGPRSQCAYGASTNQLTTSGFSYDAAGNMTADCSSTDNHTYQWDAEGRVASVDSGSTWTFTYDALGDRVQMTNPSGTQYLAYDVARNWIMVFGEYGDYDVVRWGGRMFSIYTSTGTEFNHVNNIASTMMYTNQAGTAVEDMLFYPWGQVWESWGTGGYNYAGIPYRDLSTTTDLSAFRNLSPGLGRWLSPDPVAGDITNPQSLNRYPYVLNNPTTLNDPLGLWSCRPPTSGMGSGVCAGNVLQITSAEMGWGLVGGYSAWDEFGLLLLGTTPGGPSVTYEYQYSEVSSNTINPYYDELGYYWESPNLWSPPTVTVVGVTFNSSDPGIVFTSTAPTTASFVSYYSFNETVRKFGQAGFVKFPQDYVDFFHPGALDMRDELPFCSAHLDVNKASGQGGVAATGTVHLDTFNPWASSVVPSLTGGALMQPLAHTVGDITPGILGFNTASGACL